MNKICSICKQLQSDDAFYKSLSRCKKCHKEYKKQRRKLGLDKCNRKKRIISHYSPDECCVKCGFNDIRALSVDHIDGSGASHRKTVKGGSHFYSWLIKNKFPDGFQVLCMNCQFIKKAENKEYKKEPSPQVRVLGEIEKQSQPL